MVDFRFIDYLKYIRDYMFLILISVPPFLSEIIFWEFKLIKSLLRPCKSDV